MDPVLCRACGSRFPVKGISESDSQHLLRRYYYQEFGDELAILLKVQAFYRRHPEAEGRIKTKLTRLLESKDPQITERLFGGVPFDEIDLPPDPVPAAWLDSAEGQEVVDYLCHHQCDLGRR